MTPDDLKTLRATLGLTQAQLAKQLGVTVSTVAKWEQGVHPIPGLAAKFLAQFHAIKPQTDLPVRAHRPM